MEIKFELSDQEAQLIVAALAKQPFEVVAALIQKLQQQAQPQIAAKQSAEPAP